MDHLDPGRAGGDRMPEGEALAFEGYRALVGQEEAGDDLHEGRFPGSVFAEDGVDLPREERRGNPVQSLDGAVPLGEGANFEQRQGTSSPRIAPVPAGRVR